MKTLTKNQKEMPEREISKTDKAKRGKNVKQYVIEHPRTAGQLQKM